MGLYKQATINDIGRYDDMFIQTKINTYTNISQQLILYGVILNKVCADAKNLKGEIKVPFCMYESKETLIAISGKSIENANQVSANGKAIKIHTLFMAIVNTDKLLDTLDMKDLKLYAEKYRVNKEKIDATYKKYTEQQNNKVTKDDIILKFLAQSKTISGVRRLVSEGKPLLTGSKYKDTSYLEYEIYDKSIIQDIRIV